MDAYLLYVFYALLLGLLVGSFLNVVVYRLPLSLLINWKKECEEFLEQEHPEINGIEKDKAFNIAFPTSHCPSCKAPVKAWQNIPVLSFILLRGKCASCSTSIGLRYPIVEIITGVLTALTVGFYGFSYEALLVSVFTWALISLTLIDADYQLLPDNITLPLLWLGLAANYFGLFTDLESAVLGAIFGYLSLWSVYWLFKLITGKEGMGYGDFKLLAALGAWMGWQELPTIILMSAMVGAIIGIGGILIYGKDKNKPIPFGPYLAIAGWIAFYWGDELRALYFSASGIA